MPVELICLSYDFSSCLVLVFMNCGSNASRVCRTRFVQRNFRDSAKPLSIMMGGQARIEDYSISNNFARALMTRMLRPTEKRTLAKNTR